MKLTVYLAIEGGLYAAYVVQQNTRSGNLLEGKRIRQRYAAEVDVQRKLRGCEVTFVGPEAGKR